QRGARVEAAGGVPAGRGGWHGDNGLAGDLRVARSARRGGRARAERCRARPPPRAGPTGLRIPRGYSISEFRRPIATAWARSRAERRASSPLVWVRTVSALRPSWFATVAVAWPSA